MSTYALLLLEEMGRGLLLKRVSLQTAIDIVKLANAFT